MFLRECASDTLTQVTHLPCSALWILRRHDLARTIQLKRFFLFCFLWQSSPIFTSSSPCCLSQPQDDSHMTIIMLDGLFWGGGNLTSLPQSVTRCHLCGVEKPICGFRSSSALARRTAWGVMSSWAAFHDTTGTLAKVLSPGGGDMRSGHSYCNHEAALKLQRRHIGARKLPQCYKFCALCVNLFNKWTFIQLLYSSHSAWWMLLWSLWLCEQRSLGKSCSWLLAWTEGAVTEFKLTLGKWAIFWGLLPQC